MLAHPRAVDDGRAPAVTMPPRPAAVQPFEPAVHQRPPVWTPVPEPEAPVATVASGLDPHLVAALAPQSLAAEQYRSLRTRIKRAENGRAVRAIVVTSPNKGDGKSLTAANLALTMAQEFQQRVLLIDADLRRPSVHRLFGIPEAPGLVDVLIGAAELSQARVGLPEHHLTLLPTGSVRDPPRRSSRVGDDAPRARHTPHTLRSHPHRHAAGRSARRLPSSRAMVDGVLMIVRAGVTPKPAIEARSPDST